MHTPAPRHPRRNPGSERPCARTHAPLQLARTRDAERTYNRGIALKGVVDGGQHPRPVHPCGPVVQVCDSGVIQRHARLLLLLLPREALSDVTVLTCKKSGDTVLHEHSSRRVNS